MTCEISIMNRQAIALAADSATTVREWIGGQEQTRFFKGANKIFQLSNSHPVGAMIFGSANLHEVPWELIVKDFRTELGMKSFDDLKSYAQHLFNFIKRHALFPAACQFTVCKNEITKAALIYCYYLSQHDRMKNAASQMDKEDACRTLIDSDYQRLAAAPIPKQLIQLDINHIAASCRASAKDQIEAAIVQLNLGAKIDLVRLTELAILIVCKEYSRTLASTGVVVAGFGDKDYFPGYEEYTCYGLLMGKFLFENTESQRINLNDSPSHIKPFATTAMVDTFVIGCSPDVFVEVNNQFRAALKALSDKIMGELGINTVPNLANHIQSVFDEHSRNWFNNALAAHGWPLRRVIGSLPVEEMAELAETLIMLQSLKEKVTQPTESVGGPVDVAVITRGDGFIWIKRKHYFSPELNPRFFARQNKSS